MLYNDINLNRHFVNYFSMFWNICSMIEIKDCFMSQNVYKIRFILYNRGNNNF